MIPHVDAFPNPPDHVLNRPSAPPQTRHLIVFVRSPTEADSDGSVCSRGVMEFQAEAVAYLLAHELELCDWDPAESRHYIQNWLGREEVTPSHIQKVFTAVSNILIAGRGSAGATAETAAEAA